MKNNQVLYDSFKECVEQEINNTEVKDRKYCCGPSRPRRHPKPFAWFRYLDSKAKIHDDSLVAPMIKAAADPDFSFKEGLTKTKIALRIDDKYKIPTKRNGKKYYYDVYIYIPKR